VDANRDANADANGALDVNGIMRYLPHRYPFLLLDRVLMCEPGKRLRAQKNVTINEPFFPGHFPGFPVMPGVLVIEALAQAAAILTYRTTGTPPDGDSLFFFAGIDNARFRRQVIPGDTLILEINLVRIVRGVGKFNSRAMVDDDMAAEADLMAVLRPALRARPSDRGA
jgi:3-hydroxyacyl-[acyl-carrier-protein] dehydratase